MSVSETVIGISDRLTIFDVPGLDRMTETGKLELHAQDTEGVLAGCIYTVAGSCLAVQETIGKDRLVLATRVVQTRVEGGPNDGSIFYYRGVNNEMPGGYCPKCPRMDTAKKGVRTLCPSTHTAFCEIGQELEPGLRRRLAKLGMVIAQGLRMVTGEVTSYQSIVYTGENRFKVWNPGNPWDGELLYVAPDCPMIGEAAKKQFPPMIGSVLVKELVLDGGLGAVRRGMSIADSHCTSCRHQKLIFHGQKSGCPAANATIHYRIGDFI